LFVQVRPNFASLRLPNRRAVHNHIGTVHAIAVCNGLEAAMGALAEATIPPGKRWLPKGMTVEYLAKATSDLVCSAETDPADWARGPDVPVRVKAVRADGTVVATGTINLWVTDEPTG
jgi:acyl-coenzyme A thioesterase PaaI-like protein